MIYIPFFIVRLIDKRGVRERKRGERLEPQKHTIEHRYEHRTLHQRHHRSAHTDAHTDAKADAEKRDAAAPPPPHPQRKEV